MSKEITIPADYDYNDSLYDLSACFNYAVTPPFERPTKANLHACVMGENDESSWYWLLEVGRKFYYVEGGCDYTGWDCQSWGEIEERNSLEEVLELAPEKETIYDRPIKKWLKDQLTGDLPIGVVDAV